MRKQTDQEHLEAQLSLLIETDDSKISRNDHDMLKMTGPDDETVEFPPSRVTKIIKEEQIMVLDSLTTKIKNEVLETKNLQDVKTDGYMSNTNAATHDDTKDD